jgi:hypothetical protein
MTIGVETALGTINLLLRSIRSIRFLSVFHNCWSQPERLSPFQQGRAMQSINCFGNTD